jgi:hypothetical protein
MSARPFKSAALAFAIVSFLASSALADSFTFTGSAAYGQDISDFFLSGPSFGIRSAAPGAFAGVLFFCTQGTTCHVPGFEIGAFDSHMTSPGDQSSGTVGGITAYTLVGSLFFSGTSFTAGTDPHNFGSGPITFWGDLTGFGSSHQAVNLLPIHLIPGARISVRESFMSI